MEPRERLLIIHAVCGVGSRDSLTPQHVGSMWVFSLARTKAICQTRGLLSQAGRVYRPRSSLSLGCEFSGSKKKPASLMGSVIQKKSTIRGSFHGPGLRESKATS